MHFTRPEIDNPLLSELLARSVITQSHWTSMEQPEEGTLTAVLQANCKMIDAGAWCFWLSTRHRMFRVPNLEPDSDFMSALEWPAAIARDAQFFGVFPFKMLERTVYLACLRPDFERARERLLHWLGAESAISFAITPEESKSWSDKIPHHALD